MSTECCLHSPFTWTCQSLRPLCLSVEHIIKKYCNHQQSISSDWKYHGKMVTVYSQFMLWKKVRLNIGLSVRKCKRSTKSKISTIMKWWSWTGDLQQLEYKDTQCDNFKEYWRKWTAYCQPHANSQCVQFDIWRHSAQKDKLIKEHYANILNKAWVIFPEAWPEEAKQTLSRDAFVFNRKNQTWSRNVYMKM